MTDSRTVKLAVLVAALGYFVDVYDLILFAVVRVASLKDLGLSGDQLLSEGLYLLNMQMGGMLLGGVLWGVWGDRKGRVSVLFGSIFLYSIANFLNAFVHSVDHYAGLRFVAGIGLAGELGAGVTLVSEIMRRESRGYGTTIIAAVGVLGAIVAALVGDLLSWRTCYAVGGVMGLALLLLRIAVHESGMFSQLVQSEVSRGNLKMLLVPPSRLLRYLACIMVGVPVWFVVGIIITFTPEFSKALSMSEPYPAARAVLFCYVGLTLGDVVSGVLSQLIRSRRRAISWFLALCAVGCGVFFTRNQPSSFSYSLLCILLGFSAGYWAVFVTTAAEQFGTNIRATVTTTVPNFVRGSVVLTTHLFTACMAQFGIVYAGVIVGVLSLGGAALALWSLPESFGRDLDFVER